MYVKPVPLYGLSYVSQETLDLGGCLSQFGIIKTDVTSYQCFHFWLENTSKPIINLWFSNLNDQRMSWLFQCFLTSKVLPVMYLLVFTVLAGRLHAGCYDKEECI